MNTHYWLLVLITCQVPTYYPGTTLHIAHMLLSLKSIGETQAESGSDMVYFSCN